MTDPAPNNGNPLGMLTGFMADPLGTLTSGKNLMPPALRQIADKFSANLAILAPADESTEHGRLVNQVRAKYMGLATDPNVVKLMEQAHKDPEVGEFFKERFGFDAAGSSTDLIKKIDNMDVDALKNESERLDGYKDSALIKGAANSPQLLSGIAGLSNGWGLMEKDFANRDFVKGLQDLVGLFSKLGTSMEKIVAGATGGELTGLLENSLGFKGGISHVFDQFGKPFGGAGSGAPGILPAPIAQLSPAPAG